MMHRGLVFSACLAALAMAAPAALAQPEARAPATSARPVDAEERRAVVEALAQKLETRFVFPEVGSRYAAMLRANLRAGAYEQLTDPIAFSEKVTADLQAVHPDRHLRLALREAFRMSRAIGGATPAAVAERAKALEEAKMIGDVAYLRFNMFPQDAGVAERARRFLLDNAHAQAVVIDARGHRGGTELVMDAILPLLFKERTTLVRTETRAGVHGPVGPGPTMVAVPAADGATRIDHVVTPDTVERRLQKVPVFYLTSGRTASAAEHLALALKRTGRGLIIGETTGGAGHFGGPEAVGERFAAFIPVGRSYDPDTGKGWEGVGIEPDVRVPADQALDEALRRAAAAGAKV